MSEEWKLQTDEELIAFLEAGEKETDGKWLAKQADARLNASTEIGHDSDSEPDSPPPVVESKKIPKKEDRFVGNPLSDESASVYEPKSPPPWTWTDKDGNYSGLMDFITSSERKAIAAGNWPYRHVDVDTLWFRSAFIRTITTHIPSGKPRRWSI
jgi:hypothetical protein